MKLTCDRALAIIDALGTGRLQVTAEEIEELLARALAVEAEPEDIALVGWLETTVRELLEQSSAAPGALMGLEELLRKADHDLRSDWYRMTTGRTELDRREAERVTVRRALGLMRDPAVQATLARIAQQSAIIAPASSEPVRR